MRAAPRTHFLHTYAALLLLMSSSACEENAGREPAKQDGGKAGDASSELPDATRPMPVAGEGDAGDALPSRPQLAASGAQLLVAGPNLGLQLTSADLAEDVDVVAMHLEFYGIPWAALEAGVAPPAEWTARMEELAAQSRALRRPVFLSISVLNGARERLAATTTVDGGKLGTRDDTGERCYDFASAPDAVARRRAYLRYVQEMVERFDATFVNVAIEVNLFFEKCPAAVAGLIEVSNAAYDAVKAQRPQAIVFPSFQIDHLHGYSKDSCPDVTRRDACFDAHYAQIAGMKRDRFAVSTYPFLDQITTAAALPRDWFSRAARRGGERVVIAETGWPSTSLVARAADGSCPTIFSFDEEASADYLERVLSDAAALEMDFVTWWSDRDLLHSELMTNCPCTFDATWCAVLDIFRGPAQPAAPDAQFFGEVLLKAFGAMGLRHYDGTPRVRHNALWTAARR